MIVMRDSAPLGVHGKWALWCIKVPTSQKQPEAFASASDVPCRERMLRIALAIEMKSRKLTASDPRECVGPL